MESQTPKICILHDTFLYRGGGERLIMMMGKALWADIASGFFDPGSMDLREHGFTGKIIPVMPLFFRRGFPWLPKKIGFVINNGLRHLGLKFFFAFNTGFLREYDVVVFSGDCLAGLRNVRPDAKTYYYCHTPPRYLFDQMEQYLMKVPSWIRPLYRVITVVYRRLYLRDITRVGKIFTNSSNTRARLLTFTGHDSEIIYPPVDLSLFRPLEGDVKGGYYFSWARLAGIKRVDRIVRAFQGLPDKKLKLTYGKNDPQRQEILDMIVGYENIEAIQSPSDDELRSLVSGATATIYIPVDEDFGMTPIESMGCGVPVIGVDDGWLRETIIDGQTGILISPEARIEEIQSAVDALTPEVTRGMYAACMERASEFSLDSFARDVRGKMRA